MGVDRQLWVWLNPGVCGGVSGLQDGGGVRLVCGEWGWRSAGESRGGEGMRFRFFPWLWGFGVYRGRGPGFMAGGCLTW